MPKIDAFEQHKDLSVSVVLLLCVLRVSLCASAFNTPKVKFTQRSQRNAENAELKLRHHHLSCVSLTGE